MSRESVLARGQAAAEAAMQDQCTVQRPVPGSQTTVGGVITETFTGVYTGKCRMQVRGLTSEARNVGEAYLVVSRLELQLPNSAPRVLEGDRVTLTASGNTALVNRVYRVQAAPEKSEQTCRKVTLLEVTS